MGKPPSLKHHPIAEVLSTSELFHVLNTQELCNLSEASRFLRYQEGDRIFLEGEAARGGFLVSTGRILMQKTTFKNRKIVTQLIGPGHAFGLVTAAQGLPYPLTALALSESVVLELEQEVLRKLASENAKFCQQLLQICQTRVRNAHALIARLTDASSEVRIAAALLLFAEHFASPTGATCIEVSRQELASLAGTTVETCIRITKILEERGVLRFPRARAIEICNFADLLQLSDHPS